MILKILVKFISTENTLKVKTLGFRVLLVDGCPSLLFCNATGMKLVASQMRSEANSSSRKQVVDRVALSAPAARALRSQYVHSPFV